MALLIEKELVDLNSMLSGLESDLGLVANLSSPSPPLTSDALPIHLSQPAVQLFPRAPPLEISIQRVCGILFTTQPIVFEHRQVKVGKMETLLA